MSDQKRAKWNEGLTERLKHKQTNKQKKKSIRWPSSSYMSMRLTWHWVANVFKMSLYAINTALHNGIGVLEVACLKSTKWCLFVRFWRQFDRQSSYAGYKNTLWSNYRKDIHCISSLLISSHFIQPSSPRPYFVSSPSSSSLRCAPLFASHAHTASASSPAGQCIRYFSDFRCPPYYFIYNPVKLCNCARPSQPSHFCDSQFILSCLLQCQWLCPVRKCWSYHCHVHMPLDLQVRSSVTQHFLSLPGLPPALYSVGDFCIQLYILRQRRSQIFEFSSLSLPAFPVNGVLRFDVHCTPIIQSSLKNSTNVTMSKKGIKPFWLVSMQQRNL